MLVSGYHWQETAVDRLLYTRVSVGASVGALEEGVEAPIMDFAGVKEFFSYVIRFRSWL